jgi:hypothetical protein
MAHTRALRSLLATQAAGFLMSLAPLSVFILGHLLFDVIGSPFSSSVLRAVRSVNVSGVNAAEAISDGHVWAATAHIYLLTGLFVLVLLVAWLRSRLNGAAVFPYLITATILSSLGVAYLLSVNQMDRPMKAIFLFTYASLAKAKFMGGSGYLFSIQSTLNIINLLFVVIPSVIIAFLPVLTRPPKNGWSEAELLERIKDTRLLGASASMFMVAGVLHMYAWMSWAPELINKEMLEPVVGSVVLYWGCVFAMMLATLYVPALIFLQNKAELVMNAEQIPFKERSQWLIDRGLSFKFATQLPQFIGILAPLIAAPAGKIFANLHSLLPS